MLFRLIYSYFFRKQITFLKNLKYECECDLKMLDSQMEFFSKKIQNKEIQSQSLRNPLTASQIEEKISHLHEKINKTEKIIENINNSENKSVSEINQSIILSNKLKKMQEKLDLYETSRHNDGFHSRGDISKQILSKDEKLLRKMQENEELEKELFIKLQNIETELNKVENEKEILLSQIFAESKRSEKEKLENYISKPQELTKENMKKPSINKQELEEIKGEYHFFCEEMNKIYEKVAKYFKNKDLNNNIHKKLKQILWYFNQKESQIKKFEEEKARFVEEFTRETEELTENWRLFDKKKMEYKGKLSEEKVLLYKEIDAEYKKLSEYRTKSVRKSNRQEDGMDDSQINIITEKKFDEKLFLMENVLKQ